MNDQPPTTVPIQLSEPYRGDWITGDESERGSVLFAHRITETGDAIVRRLYRGISYNVTIPAGTFGRLDSKEVTA